MLMILAAGLAFVAAATAFEGLFRSRDVGTIRLQIESRTPWQEVPGGANERVFACRVPIVNENRRYEQTLVDVRPSVRVLHRGVEEVRSRASVHAPGDRARPDGYWDACLLGAGESDSLHVVVRMGSLEAHLHAAVVTLEYETYGRGALTTHHAEAVLPLAEPKPMPDPIAGDRAWIQCIPTPLLTDTDDIVDVVDRHTASIRQPGDVVAIAESVVAITQRQFFRPADVSVGYLARRLCYFIPSKGSLSSPHGFQLAMNQVGRARLVASLFIGALGKLIGKKGLFYELAGRQAELIDDLTGTMPPFDKYIVAGPLKADDVVRRIRERTGMEAAIVDANDLRRAMVLACTPGVEAADVSRMLLDNPFGNAAEQTPIVVLRPLATDDGRFRHDQACSV